MMETTLALEVVKVQSSFIGSDLAELTLAGRASLLSIPSTMLSVIDVNGMSWDLTATTDIFHGQVNPAFFFLVA
jgi:hypothetical protein